MVTKINAMGTILLPTRHQNDINSFNNGAMGQSVDRASDGASDEVVGLRLKSSTE